MPTMNREATARLAEGARLFRELNGTVPVVLSGGPPAEYSSARVMATWIEKWGVPRDRILVEDASGDTFGSPEGVAPLIRARSRILLVTSAWHMRRALVAYERSGFDVVPAPTDFLATGAFSLRSWVPSARASETIQQMLREYLGLARDHFRAPRS